MTRPRRLAFLACLLSLAGCGAHPAAAPLTSPASRTRATLGGTAPGGAPLAEHAAVARFAAAYVRFLDGSVTASRLPDATASVRALAERAGTIPASRRRGTLLMTRLKPAAGIRDSYLLTARDQAHAVYAEMTLAEHDGRWRVTQLTPPDFLQAFAAAGPSAPPAPSGSAGAESAARRFLRGYLPWLYGQAPRRAITAATRGLLAGLTARPSRIRRRCGRWPPWRWRSRCSATATPGRPSRTSRTARRPTSSLSPSRRPMTDGWSATSARTRNEHGSALPAAPSAHTHDRQLTGGS